MNKGVSPQDIARETIEIIRMSMDKKTLQFHNKTPREDQIANRVLRIWRTVLSWKENAPEEMREEIENRLIQPRLSQIQECVRVAEQSPGMWDAMVAVVDVLGATYRPIPPALADFVVRGLKGEVKKPTKRGRPPNTDRDVMICHAVRSVLNAFPGMKATRHEDTYRKQSACEIVAEVLQNFGIGIGRRAVEDIWNVRAFPTS